VGCLYCKRIDRPFTSVEHIFPQGMGNDEKILPRGVVCDVCNNGVLAQLDQTLLDFEPVAFMRMYMGIPNKDGKLPILRYPNVVIERFADNRIRVHAKGRGRGLEVSPGEEEVKFNLNFRGKKPYAPSHCRKLSRAFYKVGLGLIYLDHGLSFCHSPRYDEVRTIIQGGIPDFHGYLLFGRRMKPAAPVTATYTFLQADGFDTTVFEMNLFGLFVGFDLERRRLDNPSGLDQAEYNVLVF